jgi:hypothetical protein
MTLNILINSGTKLKKHAKVAVKDLSSSKILLSAKHAHQMVLD